MTIHISYIKLKSDVTSLYTQTKKGWVSKDVEFSNVKNMLSNSKVQFSPLKFRNGVKSKDNAQIDKTDCIVVDSDDGYMIHEFQKTYKKFTWCLGTTKSHAKDKKGLITDRYRVVVPILNCPDDIDVYNRVIELLFPMSDKQTLTYTQAYLGNDEAITIYNEGKILDVHKATELARRQLEEERLDKVTQSMDRDLFMSTGSLNVDLVKEQMVFETILDVLDSLGYEVVGNKYKLRPDERSHSCKIYSDGGMKDFGGDFTGDIFGVLMEYHSMTFPQAVRYVQQFI